MNAVRLNEDVHKAIDVVFPDMNREHVPGFQAKFKNWPLLTYDLTTLTADEITAKVDACANFVREVFRTPFDSYRFWNRTTHGLMYGSCSKATLSQRQGAGEKLGGLAVVAVVTGSPLCIATSGNLTEMKETPGHFINVKDADKRDEKIALKIYIHPNFKPGEAFWSTRAFWLSSGKEITAGPHHALLPRRIQAALDFTVSWVIICLEIAATEYLSEGNHVAKVWPDPTGRSVQWLQAREHYTIIHRRHPANSKGVKSGSVVYHDTNGQLLRLAHARRAHDRYLRSERFRRDAFTGAIRKIKINSTWCGPKEWKDTAGQTYQIVGLPAQAHTNSKAA